MSVVMARGVLFVHSAPTALCPHVEWAIGSVIAIVIVKQMFGGILPRPDPSAPNCPGLDRRALVRCWLQHFAAGPICATKSLKNRVRGSTAAAGRILRSWASSMP